MNAHPHDALIEMVLGHLDPQDQPGVTDHLESCAACRATAKQLLGVVDDVTRLAPVAEPPAGFVERVLASLDPAPLSLRRDRRRARPWGAVAAVAGLGLGVGAWQMVRTAPAAPSGALRASAVAAPAGTFGQPMSLLTGTRKLVGTASFGADSSGRAAVRISLAGTPPAPWYRCARQLVGVRWHGVGSPRRRSAGRPHPGDHHRQGVGHRLVHRLTGSGRNG
jgi:hypothetical protein